MKSQNAVYQEFHKKYFCCYVLQMCSHLFVVLGRKSWKIRQPLYFSGFAELEKFGYGYTLISGIFQLFDKNFDQYYKSVRNCNQNQNVSRLTVSKCVEVIRLWTSNCVNMSTLSVLMWQIRTIFILNSLFYNELE